MLTECYVIDSEQLGKKRTKLMLTEPKHKNSMITMFYYLKQIF